MSQSTLSFGPRLAASPTGHLQSAVLVRPTQAIERAKPLQGEPNAFLSRALAQHAILAKTLRQNGCEVRILEPSGDDPYVCAAADAAVVFENGAVIMRLSSMTRRAESAWIEAQFEEADVPIAGHVTSPALLDGGDVLLIGKSAFIARSRRSNALGREAFARIAQAHAFEVREVEISDRAPALRAVAAAVARDTVVLGGDFVDAAAFSGFKTVVAPAGQELGAGVLNLGEHHVLADVRFPGAIDALRERGITVEAIDLHDFSRVGLTPSLLAVDVKRT